MENPFDSINDRLSLIEKRLFSIENLIKSQLKKSNDDTESDRLSLPEAAEFLKLKKTTIYGLTFKGKIPYRKFGKLLVFSRKELKNWLEENSKNPAVGIKTVLSEIQKSANRKSI
jgi:excisionase family DNA binding protein